MKPDPASAYLLGHSEHETRRLMLQDQIYRPITRRFLEAAGVSSGMRVLDAGSGAGDVSLLLAEMVGPTGEVVGVDMNAQILEVARSRVAAVGWRNVRFEATAIEQMNLDAGFDAVVGRWVLMYVRDPSATVKQLASRLVPGGILAFHEMDLTYPPATFPEIPLSSSLKRWLITPAGAPGPNTRMGSGLHRIFLEAGLPAPAMRLEAPMGGGSTWPGYEYIAETLRSLMPALQAMTGLDPSEVDIETLADRFRNEAVAANAVHMLPMIVGASARRR